ncbi:MAG: peptidyl-prolyl cis-trans isomerase [Candidatus Sumerlaeaceae bacterium]|nr:peptidyl-prolyl cis-trans isomerase [Candidatus Sumerlaeaceae bacterium]
MRTKLFLIISRLGMAALTAAVLVAPETASAQKSNRGRNSAKATPETKAKAKETPKTEETPVAEKTPAPEKSEAPKNFDNIARIGSFVLTSDALTSYSNLIEQVDGMAARSQDGALQDFILGKLIEETFTTVPVGGKDAPKPSTPEPSQVARQLLKNLLRQKVTDGIKPTREEMSEWVKENGKFYGNDERVNARHLFMQVSKDNPTSSPEAARARMEEALKEIKGGKPFADVAKKWSEAGSGERGGQIGFVTARMPMGPENKPMNIVLETALFKLKTGEVSEILQTTHGLHLLYAEEHQTTYVPTIDDLISSNILPAAIVNTKIEKEMQELTSNTVARLKGEVTSPTADMELTTATVAFKLGGKSYTISQLENIYGQRFTAVFNRRRGSPAQMQALFREAMNDEAAVLAALDQKLDKQPEVAENLNFLRQRDAMKKKLQAIVAADYPANEEVARKEYDKVVDQLRRPEFEGWMLSIKHNASQTTDPEEQKKITEEAKAKIEGWRKQIADGGNIEEIARANSQDDYATSGGFVARHVIGAVATPSGQTFDSIANFMKEPGELTDPRATQDGFVIVKLKQRWPGEATPFEAIKGRILNKVQMDNEKKAKMDILAILEASGKLQWLEGSERFGMKPSKP